MEDADVLATDLYGRRPHARGGIELRSDLRGEVGRIEINEFGVAHAGDSEAPVEPVGTGAVLVMDAEENVAPAIVRECSDRAKPDMRIAQAEIGLAFVLIGFTGAETPDPVCPSLEQRRDRLRVERTAGNGPLRCGRHHRDTRRRLLEVCQKRVKRRIVGYGDRRSVAVSSVANVRDPARIHLPIGPVEVELDGAVAHNQTTFYEAWRLVIQRYGIKNPYTGRGAIMGLLPHGPHNVRDVLATHILKQTGSYEQASYAIQDTPETVLKHYGRFLPQDKAALAAQILNRVWEAA